MVQKRIVAIAVGAVVVLGTAIGLGVFFGTQSGGVDGAAAVVANTNNTSSSSSDILTNATNGATDIVITNATGGTTSNGTSGSIDCNMTTAMETMGGFFSMLAGMNMDEDNMMEMPSMAFNCMNETEEPATYFKTKASVQESSFFGDGDNKETVWVGAMKEGGGAGAPIGFATLVRSATGFFTGSFTTKVASYSVMTTADGTMTVRKTMWADFDLGSALPSPSFVDGIFDGNDEDDEANFTSGVSMMNLTMEGENRRLSSSSMDVVGNGQKQLPKVEPFAGLRGGAAAAAPRELQTTVIDILVLVTNPAYCHNAWLEAGCEPSYDVREPMWQQLKLHEHITNEAMQNVGVTSVGVRIVDAIFLAPGYDRQVNSNTLDQIRNSPAIQTWRRNANADLVAMIVGTTTGNCGIAYLEAPESVTRLDCLESYTFSHEIGHNIGCLHDRNNCPNDHEYAHGYQSPGNFRTIMAYPCSGGTCDFVLPWYSADGYVWNGVAFGSEQHDNARYIKENAFRAASFM